MCFLKSDTYHYCIKYAFFIHNQLLDKRNYITRRLLFFLFIKKGNLTLLLVVDILAQENHSEFSG